LALPLAREEIADPNSTVGPEISLRGDYRTNSIASNTRFRLTSKKVMAAPPNRDELLTIFLDYRAAY
jgi:hypothetical protein